MQQRRPRYIIGAVVIVLLIIAYIVGIAVFAITTTPSNTPVPITGAPTGAPTSTPTQPSPITPTGSPVSIAPTPPVFSTCICGENEQPIYDTFAHPLHTEESFARFNFYNHNGIDPQGNPLTVWVTVALTADARMQAEDPRFVAAYDYVYMDGQRLERGQNASLVIPKSITANGRMAGGRIYVYYENPSLHDALREIKYGGHYPVQSPGNIVPISGEDGLPRTPSNLYVQLLEFTLDVVVGTDIDTKAFIDYDLSAVDRIAMPVYIFGGYDPRTLPNATTGNNNNGFPCGKAYIGCHTPQETINGCPTQIVDEAQHGSTCLAAFPYCQLLPGSGDIVDPVNWNTFCHKFDTIAEGFGINQTLLDFYAACRNNNNLTPPCPPVFMPILRTPTTAIYGCVGQFLLENHCLLDGSRYTQSHLDGTQCSALNRGLCFTPDFNHVPEPCGLSCSRFLCPGNPPDANCLIPCLNYSCFGALCPYYAALPPFDASCSGITCPVGGGNTNCVENIIPVCKSRVSTCNDSTPDPYLHGLIENNYSAWVRNKGQRFYGFSLDEEVGGGNQQCLYSTQLDVVIYPRCNGTFTSK